jgi:exopolyphosphatase/guanosine-5'-triphosphate,3'-diphosphate pyrophosphatase
MAHVIACDLGSNTLRIVQIDCTTKERVKAFERIVRTAQDLHKTKKISNAAIQRIHEALQEASTFFDFKTLPTRCVTTQALRSAQNSKMLLEALEHTFGLHFEIISGEDEAYFTRIGVQGALERVGMLSHSYMLMDLGGGSLELTCKAKEDITAHSFPFGIVTLAEAYATPKSFTKALQYSLQTVQQVTQRWLKPETFIATAGTPTTVAAFLNSMPYKTYDYQAITGEVLSAHDYNKALALLLEMSEEEREHWVGVGRSDLIIAGIEIVVGLMKTLGYSQTLVVDDGLREGVAMALCKKSSSPFYTL